ncbi:MAG: 3-hydroxyacyl-CoA dehydrogenase [Candidatus Bathyarchaeota archaeon]|nr:MAG: 3-hydroxyacyl-CoA dehydrogenase [Candidatus Bathyarchaeota archaeon]
MKAANGKTIGVVGAGAMGHGVAQILAMAGHEVVLIDIDDKALKKAEEKIRWSLDKFAEKRRIRQEDADAAFSRIKTTTDHKTVASTLDLVIEATPESLELKKNLFTELDTLIPQHGILASNTSTLSITEMGKATTRPEKVAGMHFFNPPQLMTLVEVIKGDKTSPETVESLVTLANQLGKTPVVVRKDVRGFIVNRILGSVFNEAFWAVNREEVTREGVDASVKYSGGFPMGWFELADFVGLDIVYEVGKILHNAYGERLKPCTQIIEPLIKKGELGQKTGNGFYDWSKGRPRIPFSLLEEFDVDRSWAVAVNEAAWIIHDDAADPEDIDTGMKLGTYWPSGPCEYADRTGIDVIVQQLQALHKKYALEIYNVCPLLEDYVKKGWIGKTGERGFYK